MDEFERAEKEAENMADSAKDIVENASDTVENAANDAKDMAETSDEMFPGLGKATDFMEKKEGEDAASAPTAAQQAEKPAVKESSAQKPADKPKTAQSGGNQQQGGKTGLAAWFRDVKAEFHKIVWPNRKELSKMTVTVVIVSLLFGALIAGLDVVFRTCVGFMVDTFKMS